MKLTSLLFYVCLGAINAYPHSSDTQSLAASQVEGWKYGDHTVNKHHHGNASQAAAAKQIKEWQHQYNKYIFKELKNRTSGCTFGKLKYRRECASSTPKLSDDDVIATHIFQAPFIHFSGIFLPWHRYYTYIYDKLLREECGYTGPQPYWDWSLTYEDPRKSKIFDGSVDSMGSNGKSVPHNGTDVSAFGLKLTIPPATGGGCVYEGPFTDYVVNLGPASYAPKVGDGSGLDYNPRCMKRDVSLVFANNTKPTDVVALLGLNGDLEAFDDLFESPNGLHAGGHFTIGGDPGNDPFVSAGDPIFYLHHAQVDRMWTIWQALDPEKRFGKVFGTSTAFNNPPSPNITLDFKLQFEVLADSPTVGEVDSTIDGPFCYIYV